MAEEKCCNGIKCWKEEVFVFITYGLHISEKRKENKTAK